MRCPSCFLPDANLNYLCYQCSREMCDECAAFALRCDNSVCYECRHECDDPECKEILPVHMTVGDLLRVYAGETFSTQHWERIGKSFTPDSIRLLHDLSIDPIIDSIPFSFPEILSVRVFKSGDYTSIAKQLWRRIRLANCVPDSVSSYLTKISQMSDHDFMCWYQHRHLTHDDSFESRIFCRNPKLPRLMNGDLVKEMLKNDIEEDYHIPK